MLPQPSPSPVTTVLVVDEEVIVRSAIAEYLRDCGYLVLEAAHAGEAIAILQDPTGLDVEIVLSAVEMRGGIDGFGLSRWVREHRPDVEVILAGTPKRAAASAAQLCDSGPTLSRPYEPQVVHDRIMRMLAERKPRRKTG
jgi:CheY-like chemotaxis protein